MLKVLLLFERFLVKMSMEFSECTEFKDKHQHYYYQPHYPENEWQIFQMWWYLVHPNQALKHKLKDETDILGLYCFVSASADEEPLFYIAGLSNFSHYDYYY